MDRRGNGYYFYRSVRVGDRVEKRYGGGGRMGTMIVRYASDLRHQLAGPSTTALQWLLGERVATAWAFVNVAEWQYAGTASAGKIKSIGEDKQYFGQFSVRRPHSYRSLPIVGFLANMNLAFGQKFAELVSCIFCNLWPEDS